MNSRFANKLEIFNEVMIMMSIYPLILYTDFVPSPEAQYQVGWVAIGISTLQVGVNLGFMCFLQIREIISACRKKFCGAPDKVKINVKQEGGASDVSPTPQAGS